MQKLSVVIITYNEESRIRPTLESIKWCDEIIIVDSGSTDKTLEICKEYENCKILVQAFAGYGPQKKFGVEQASNNWILSIDADEILTNELSKEIQDILTQAEISINAYYVPITMIFLGKIFHFGSENKFPHLRFFNKTKGNFNDLKLHEGVEIEGFKGNLKNEILHNSYRDIHHYIEKLNQYTTVYKNEALKKGKKKGWLIAIFRFKLEFIKQYFFRLNFLNGYPGFVWSILCSFYVYVKYTKVYEANLKQIK